MLTLRRGKGRQPHGVVGLTLERGGVALVHVAKGGVPRPRLLSCETLACDDPARLGAVLTEAVQARHLGRAPCCAVLPRDFYGLWLLDAPEVEPSELGGAIRWLVRDLIEFPIDDAVTDYFELPDDTTRGRRRRIYVVAARAEHVQQTLDAARESGLVLGPIDITELALRNVAVGLSRHERSFALLQLGPQRGLLTITRGRSLLLARELDVGLEALAAAPPAPSAGEADAIPLESEADPRDALLLEVQRSLDYLESQMGQAPVDELVLAPLERPAPGLLEFLEKNLVARVRRFGLGELLEGGDEVPEPVQARCLAAVGAALREETDGA